MALLMIIWNRYYIQDDASVDKNTVAPTTMAKETKKKRPVTVREQYNLAFTLFKAMAVTLSGLTAAQFQEKLELFLEIHDKMNK